MTSRQDLQLESVMGRMQRVGVTASAIVVLAGGALFFWQFGDSVSNYRHFDSVPQAPLNIAAILFGVRHLDSRSVISAGLLLLIATPVCRVISGVVGFALQRDRIYTIVSAIVLIVLLMSFFVRR
jgi:uncharacterized membrane protein